MSEPSEDDDYLDYPGRNDVPGALAFIREVGSLNSDDVEVLLRLQDDPTELEAAIEKLEAEGFPVDD
jgi:hypothetical protein